jgi:hypothetical protein
MDATIREGEPARNNKGRGAGTQQERKGSRHATIRKRHNYRYREWYKGGRAVIPKEAT